MAAKKSRASRRGGKLIGGGKNQRKQLEAIGYGVGPKPKKKPTKPKKK